MNKTSFWKSANFWTQVLTVLLGIFAIGGAKIDAAGTSGNLINAIWGNSSWAIGTILIINVINPIFQWSKAKLVPTTRWAFLHSINWWTAFATIVLSIPIAYGIYDESIYGIIPDVIRAVSERNWYNLLSIVGVNLIIPIIKIFVNRPVQK